MLSSRRVDVNAIATTVDFAGKKSIIDVWKGPKYAFALWRMKNLIDNKQIPHVFGANN